MKKLLLALSAAILAASPSVAQKGKGAGLSEACRTEVRTLCGAVRGDREARRTCMKENRSKLSEGCAAELTARKEARKAARADSESKPQ